MKGRPRVQNKKKGNEMVENVFGRCPTEELLVEVDRIGVPAGPIRSIREVYAWEQTRSQALLIDVNHSTLGPITLPGPPLRFLRPQWHRSHARTHRLPAPVLGADNNTVSDWPLQGAVR
jgi:crotonobetainyl-CoA:carnitine CoA-transferase CaiB-like acyl-CoA transferase